MVATEKKPAKKKAHKSVYRVVEGVVEKADLETRAPFRRNFYAMGETVEFYLNVCVRLPDGSAAYFNSVNATRTVVSCCGDGIAAAVVTHRVEGEAAKWLAEVNRDKSVVTPGVTNENKLVPLVKVGDTVRVMGRLKMHRISRHGKRYVVLTHVWKDPPADAESDPLPPPVETR